MTAIRTMIARAMLRLAIFAAPPARRAVLDDAFQALGRGGPGAPD